MLLLGCALLDTAFAGEPMKATVREDTETYRTYPFSDPNPVARTGRYYPYFRFDGFTDEAVPQEWRVVTLENEYIRVRIFPEIGGKIWSATDKKSGEEFIYDNSVVKFRDVAMRGPWTSGGVEYNFGIYGHAASCSARVHYVTSENEDGSACCTVGGLDLLTRTEWSVEIRLERDKGYFTTRVVWDNDTELHAPYYHWMNAGLKVNEHLEFLYPGRFHVGHFGEHGPWPRDENGRQIGLYRNNDYGGYKSFHIMGRYTRFNGAYYHDSDTGMIRYGMRDGKLGAKLWMWGLSRQGMIWEDLLTDSDGQYFELQSGRLFTQNAERSLYSPFKHTLFAPCSGEEWVEYWYPISGTGGAVEANNIGALNLRRTDRGLALSFSAASPVDAPIRVISGKDTLYRRTLRLAPLEVFQDTVCPGGADVRVVLGDNLLVYDSKRESETLGRPLDTPGDFDWNSAYACYLKARGEMGQKLYAEAERSLAASLSRDPNFLPALALGGELACRNMEYDRAFELLTKALSIDTYDGQANYVYGLVNEKLGRMEDARDGYDVAALSVEYRSAAYTRLAAIYFRDREYDRARYCLDRALKYDGANRAAWKMDAVLCRVTGCRERHERIVRRLREHAPASHFSDLERLLGGDASVRVEDRSELACETFIEHALFYYDLGLEADALKVFEQSPASPVVALWIARLKGLTPDYTKIDVGFCFPFREQTARMLEYFSRKAPHWKADYLLSLILVDRNRREEGLGLLARWADTPDFAPFYALRASLQEDAAAAEHDLLRASAYGRHWRYAKLCTEFYLRIGDRQKALDVVQREYRKNTGNPVIGLLYARALLETMDYGLCEKVLSGLHVIPFEGATEAQEIYRECKLNLALEDFGKGDFRGTVSKALQAKEYPEHLGSGSPFPDEVDYRIEDFILFLAYDRMGEGARARRCLENVANARPSSDLTGGNFLQASSILSDIAAGLLHGAAPAPACWDETACPEDDPTGRVSARMLPRVLKLYCAYYESNTCRK